MINLLNNGVNLVPECEFFRFQITETFVRPPAMFRIRPETADDIPCLPKLLCCNPRISRKTLVFLTKLPVSVEQLPNRTFQLFNRLHDPSRHRHEPADRPYAPPAASYRPLPYNIDCILRHYMKLVKKNLMAQIIKALPAGISFPESGRALMNTAYYPACVFTRGDPL